MWLRVLGLGCWLLRVLRLGFRVLGFDLRFRVSGFGLGFGV